MRHSEFRIGAGFTCAGRRWRCTDVGSRVVVAIRTDAVEQTYLDGKSGEVRIRVLARAGPDERGDLDGPPYGALEWVLDEDDQQGCEPL